MEQGPLHLPVNFLGSSLAGWSLWMLSPAHSLSSPGMPAQCNEVQVIRLNISTASIRQCECHLRCCWKVVPQPIIRCILGPLWGYDLRAGLGPLDTQRGEACLQEQPGTKGAEKVLAKAARWSGHCAYPRGYFPGSGCKQLRCTGKAKYMYSVLIGTRRDK